jgi:hypothetical protein
MSNVKVKEAWDWLKRFGTQQQKELFRPVYHELERLKKRVAELEKIHDQYMAPQMFKPTPTDKEILIQMQIEKRRLEAREPIQFSPLKERLALMIKENKVGSKEWEKALKWSKGARELAEELLNEKKS